MLRGPRKKWSMRDSLQRVHFDQEVVTDSHFLTRWPVPLLVAYFNSSVRGDVDRAQPLTFFLLETLFPSPPTFVGIHFSFSAALINVTGLTADGSERQMNCRISPRLAW